MSELAVVGEFLYLLSCVITLNLCLYSITVNKPLSLSLADLQTEITSLHQQLQPKKRAEFYKRIY